MKSRSILLWITVSLLTVTVINCSKDNKSDSTKPVVTFSDSTVAAIVNGDAISYNEINVAVKQLLTQAGKSTDFLNNAPLDTTLQKEALDWLISTRLLAHEAKQQNIKVNQTEIDNALNIIKRRFPTEQKFYEALEQDKMTMDQYVENLKSELRVQKLLEQQVGSKVGEITDQEALQYYQQHGDEFLQNEQIRVHHILIKVAETADKKTVNRAREKGRRILEKIKKGENFEALARQYSEDPSAFKGGDIGFFSRGDMIEKFEQAAFALNIGEVSDLVRTPLGFHIIRLDEKKSKQKIPFEEVKFQIKTKLKQQRTNKLFEEYVNELKSKADIKIREQV